ncbi:hypothetical protein [Fluviispira sanaruensis]|uniref:Vitamin B12-dependent ribonucleotide reductase n=1 Tax=Fluviispira sanaruensis TaxID=2493639 RepID=A0A4P2VGJ7_FLUSA|nr:hypothetical protein [Fluviispira sanaruensis]BBH52003.1 ribonucleoside-diphosphate reductase, adenosylcobalamin-dependent [Fluviispira sanaruensis]
MLSKILNEYQFTSELYKNIIENKYCFEIVDTLTKEKRKEKFTEAIQRVAYEVNKYDNSAFDEMQEKTIQYIQAKDFSPAGGIWRAAGNKTHKISYVNCTTQAPVKDSIEEIFAQSLTHWSRIASYGQGNGIDISGLRPRGAITQNCAKASTGAVSFLSIFDAAMQVIGAENRRGATKPDIWIYHPDAEEFITCKSDITKLTSQNVSVKVDTEFINAVIENKNILMNWERKENKIYIGSKLFDDNSPGPNLSVQREINAQILFHKIAFQAWKTGEPGIEFWDQSEKYSNSNYHPDKKYHIVSTNGCSEQKLDPFNTCVLASINFYNMPLLNENWQEWLKERVEFGVRFLDNVIIAEYQENRSPHPTQREKLKEMTRIGLGFTGLYDWFIKSKLRYGSEKSISVTEKIMKVFTETAYRTSIQLGKERGSFKEFKKEWFIKSPFIKRLCQLTSLELEDFTEMRHVCCLTVAPTGTLSMLVGVGGSGCEPAFAPYLERRERTLTGEYKSHLIFDNCVINELNRKKISLTKQNAEKLVEENEWIFAAWNKKPEKNIDPLDKLKLIATLYKYIDSGISVTYNLPENARKEDIWKIYLTAWQYGLKSVTVYRDKSREGVLKNLPTDNGENISKKLKKIIAVKRPNVLSCDIHNFKLNKKNWLILIGLLENDPYEVFCGYCDANSLPENFINSEIIKRKNKKYFLKFKNIKEINLKNLLQNKPSESAITRLVSLNLRHGVDIKYIVQQLEKTEGSVTHFASAINRVLKKYIKDGTKFTGEICPNCQKSNIIYQAGCMTCADCGWSRC